MLLASILRRKAGGRKATSLFNREAALQVAQRELHKLGGDISASEFWDLDGGNGPVP